MDVFSKHIKQNPLIAYFFLAYGISWLLLAPLWILNEANATVNLVLVVASAFGPAVSAAIIITVTEGKTGMRRWFKGMFVWRVSLTWYLVALMCPVILTFLGYGIYVLLGGTPLLDWQPPSLSLFFATLAFLFFFGGGQEEAGWRGFALPRLQARYNALISSIILGFVWAFWHLPVFFIQ